MATKRIDVDANRWIELRDRLVYYVRFQRRALQVIVAPAERIEVVDRSEYAGLRDVSLSTVMLVFAIPVFATCVLVLNMVTDDETPAGLVLALAIAMPATVCVSYAIRRGVQFWATRESRLHFQGTDDSTIIRIKHERWTDSALDAFIAGLPRQPVEYDNPLPRGVAFKVSGPLTSPIGILGLVANWGCALTMLYLTDDALSVVLALVFGLLAGINTFVNLLDHFMRGSRVRLAFHAILDRDIDVAELLLNRAVEESPRNPYAHHLLLGLAMLKGDLQTAVHSAEIATRSMLLKLTCTRDPMPDPDRLRALADYNNDTIIRSSPGLETRSADEQPAH